MLNKKINTKTTFVIFIEFAEKRICFLIKQYIYIYIYIFTVFLKVFTMSPHFEYLKNFLCTLSK